MTTQHAETITADLLDDHLISHADVGKVAGLVEILFTEDYSVPGVVEALVRLGYVETGDEERVSVSINETMAHHD